VPVALGAALLVLLVGLVLLALTASANTWAKAVMRNVAASRGGGFLNPFLIVPRLFLRVVIPGVNYIAHKVSEAAAHYTHPLASWLHALQQRERLLQQAAIGLAEDVAHGFERGFGVRVPREIRRRLGPIAEEAAAALGLAGLTRAALRRYAHGIDRLLRERVLPQLRRLERIATRTIPRELAHVGARVRGLEHELRNPTRAVLRRLARSLWLLGLAGLMIRALARRFPWLFCRKVKAVGGRVCGLDNDLLNSLLLDTLLIAGGVSVVEFARELQALEGGAVKIMRGFIREL